ncbi:transposable element Tc3 transposase [Trichonephila clavipes]|nr:transposable element Tc3 transposase [Trichonephila clavipes]
MAFFLDGFCNSFWQGLDKRLEVLGIFMNFSSLTIVRILWRFDRVESGASNFTPTHVAKMASSYPYNVLADLELWFQQDGATCHTARATIDLLKDTFGDRLISRFGPVNWPPRSCDLTPLDYFLQGYIKSLDYANKPETLDHLEDNIRRVLPIFSHKYWKKSSKIGRPDWTTSEPAVSVICQKSYLKCNATRLCFE